jgi:hypothetical protein
MSHSLPETGRCGFGPRAEKGFLLIYKRRELKSVSQLSSSGSFSLIDRSLTNSEHLISLPLTENFFWHVALHAQIAQIVLLDDMLLSLY